MTIMSHLRTPGGRRTRRAGTVFAAAAVLGTLAAATPADAAARTPMQRCLSSGNPDASETIAHPGNQVGTSFPSRGADPENAIFPGDVVRVTVTGAIRTDLWGNTAGPDGTGFTGGSAWPFPDQFEFSSVARWNHQGPGGGWVGAPMQTTSLGVCTRAPEQTKVRLLYYINDPGQGDNGGAFSIRTDVFWGDGS